MLESLDKVVCEFDTHDVVFVVSTLGSETLFIYVVPNVLRMLTAIPSAYHLYRVAHDVGIIKRQAQRRIAWSNVPALPETLTQCVW